ncbi:MAG: L,D-transpeptidase [Pseudonocardiales bacterium]|nr:L,D-transpeptidase [Pseudonocardiales bacterium]
MAAKGIALGVVAGSAALVVACSPGPSPSAQSQPPAPSAQSLTSVTPTTTSPSATTTAPTTTSTRPKPTTTTTRPKPAPSSVQGTPCTSTARVSACVDLSARKAWLLRNGQVIYGPVSMLPGKTGSRTPIGNWHVIGKERMHYSKEFDNAPMPYSVFFYPGDAFHAGSLRAFSNGCVHLSTGAAATFFNTLSIGDPVQIKA